MAGFSPTNSTPSGSAPVTPVTAGRTPTIQNFPLTAGVDQAVILPVGTTGYVVKTRNGSAFEVRMSVGLDYLSIPRSVAFQEGDLSLLSPQTFYYLTQASGETLELIYWTN